MTAARDELADEVFLHRPILSMQDGSIASCTCMDRVFITGSEEWDTHVADAILAAGYTKPRVVTTAAELDACNLDAVVVDRGGCPRTKRYGNSHMPGGWTNAGRDPLKSTELANGHEMTVVFEGRA